MVSLMAAAGTYCADQVISLKINSAQSPLNRGSTVRFRIKRLQQPWTLSCGMIGAILGDFEDETVAFLKLYDRRWAHQLRSDHGIKPWTPDIEKSYIDSVRSGQAAEFLDKLDQDEELSNNPQDDWSDAENETFLLRELHTLYTAETVTYAALNEQQGILVPRLLAKVTLDLAPSEAVTSGKELWYTQAPGVLLQYLPGFTMSVLDQHAPQLAWQGIVDEAVHITRVLGDFKIRNADVRPDNFIVVPAGGDGYRVYMIDFGQCRVRRDGESDAEWGRAKWQQDEEGAIGLVMRLRLRRLGFEYKYEPSMRYLEWAPGEDDEDA